MRLSKDFKNWVGIGRSAMNTKLLIYLIEQEIKQHDWVDLRVRNIAKDIGYSKDSIYSAVMKLVKEKVLKRVDIKDNTNKGRGYFVGVIDFRQLLLNYREKYPFLPVSQKVLDELQEYQDVTLDILENQDLLLTKNDRVE